MGDVLRWVFAFGIRFLMALGLPWIWIQVFQGQGNADFFLSWSLWLVFLGGMLRYTKNKTLLFRILLGTVFVFLLLTGLIIFFTMAAFSPLEAVEIWIKALKSGPAPGSVSFHLGILLGFVSTLLAVLSWGVGLRGPVLVFVLVLCALGMAVVPHPLWLFTAGGSLIALGGLAVRSGQPRISGWKLMAESFLLPFAAALLSLPLFFFPLRSVYDAPKALNILIPLAQEFVNPEIWALAEDQEGLGAKITSDALPPRVKSPLFRVRGQPETAYYFRAQIFDFFSGSRWQRFPQVNKAPWKNLRVKPGFESHLTLEVTAELLPLIPHTLNTREIQVASQGRNGAVMAQFMPQGVRLEEPLRRGDVVYLQRGAGSVWERDPQKEMNLQGLGNLSLGVTTLFRSLNLRPDRGAPAYALQVRNYLGNNYAYVLKNPAGKGTPLENFLLHERSGWSAHFASAAVMLLRHGGVPARLVKGYLTVTDSRGTAEITTLHQHQWAEFYWEKFGWLPLETCPPFQRGQESEELFPDSYEDSRTRDQVDLITGRAAGKDQQLKGAELVWILSVISVGLLSLVAVILRLRRMLWEKPGAANPLMEIIPELQLLVKRAKRKTRTIQPEVQGWLKWTEIWTSEKEWLPHRLKTLILNKQFGHEVWTSRDRKFLKILRRRIRR